MTLNLYFLSHLLLMDKHMARRVAVCLGRYMMEGLKLIALAVGQKSPSKERSLGLFAMLRADAHSQRLVSGPL